MGDSIEKKLIIFRTSDKGRVKPKLSNDREFYLKNVLEMFKSDFIICIADNVNDNSFLSLKSKPFFKLIRTDLGNSGSFAFAVDLVLKLNLNIKHVYFLEDDYFHLELSREVLDEGLLKADYVSLYDHPDKYIYGINPFVNSDGSESTRVYFTGKCHWKLTNSTTMTFATKIDILKRDRFWLKAFSVGWKFGKYMYPRWFYNNGLPRDFILWFFLTRLKRRKLISPIPSFATHGELDQLSPLWEKKYL